MRDPRGSQYGKYIFSQCPLVILGAHRDVPVVAIHRPGHEAGVPRHDAVDRRVREQRAVQVVGGVRRHSADHVRRVDVLHREELPCVLLLPSRLQLTLEPRVDVLERRVARLVVLPLPLRVGPRDEALSGALGVAVLLDVVVQEVEEAAGAGGRSPRGRGSS